MYIAIYAGLLFVLIINSSTIIMVNGKPRRDKLNNICLVAFSVVTALLYTVSVNTFDSENYNFIFTYSDSLVFNSDPFFHRLVDLVKLFTVDYATFRLIIGLISVIPLVYIGRRKLGNNSLFLMLCLLFPYFQNMVSLRNTVAMTFALFSFYIWANYEHNFKYFIISMLLSAIASLFHMTCIFYLLIIVLCYIIDRIKPVQTFLLLLTIASLMTILIRMGFLGSFLRFVVGSRNQSYLTDITSRGLGFLIVCFFQFCITYILNRKCKIIDESDNENKYFARNILILNVALIVLIPLYSINILSFRMYRNLMPLLYMVLAFEDNKKNWIIPIMAVVLCICLLLFDANGIMTIQTVLVPN